jgi:hypothetical protein
MRDEWRTGLILAVAVVGGATAANAQDSGAAAGAPVAGATAGARVGGSETGAVSGNPAAENAAVDASRAAAAIRLQSSRAASHDRVTTTRRKLVPASPRGTSPGKASASRPDPRPYTSRAMRARADAAQARIPAGSTGQPAARRPMTSPPLTIESTTRSYYPGMRPGQQPNANKAQVGNGQRRSGTSAVILPGAGMGIGTGGGARVTRPGASQNQVRDSRGSTAPR